MRYVSSCCCALALAVLLSACGKSNPAGTSSPTTYSVGGSVAGLTGTLVLQNNGGDSLSISSNGTFAFSTTLAPNATYDVTILTQPANQTCSVSNPTGTLTSSISSVLVSCVSTSTVTNQWMWRSGADDVGAAGVYGTQGSAAATNTPGSRREPISWTDASGNLWLFGGYGTGAGTASVGMLDDLWEFSPTGASALQWVWQGGSQSAGAAAAYGTLGTPAAGNDPGARAGSASWADAAGNLWLFGGSGLAGQSSEQFNDLWEYQASSAEWVWVGGSSSANGAGSYGALGVAAAGNLPPARTNAVSWVDGSGVFWLFGGAQFNADGSLAAVFNDLWSYDPTSGLWTWVSGSNTPDAAAVYGTQGIAAAGNVPGARLGASAWVDPHGNFWLFGGEGQSGGVSQQYSDLWEYSPGNGDWTWVGGVSAPDTGGVYGTMGSAAAGDAPGARVSALTWEDAAGNFWLFGGYGYDQGGVINALNDLWQYDPSTGLWTWVGGSSSGGAAGNYGTQGTSAATNVPGARQQAAAWRDASGNFWLFGGYGIDAFGAQGNLNDLWVYTPNP